MLQRLTMLASAVGMVMTIACAETDPGITTAVKSKLAADDTVKAYQIDVDTADGVVTLTGTVDAPAAKEHAVLITRQTDGVIEVVDHLVVSNAPAPTSGEIRDSASDAIDRAGDAADRAGAAVTDASITASVKTKVLADSRAPGLAIDVDTKNGVVTLSGDVSTRAEADRAVALARETDGVKSVVNNIKVR